MGELTAGTIEEISIIRIKDTLLRYGNLKSNISENDKEPSWDGFIYVYSKCGTEKKEDLVGRVPIQVKGTEVKKFSNKFNSFNIKISDLKNYLNDGGVIFFVVEIKSDTTAKIFYKELLPVDLKIYLAKAANNGWKSLSIKIDKLLDKDIKFDKTCKTFLTHRKLQSSVAINNSISIDDIKNTKGKTIAIIGEDNPFDTIDKDVYIYIKDEFNNSIPLNSKVTIEEVCCTIETDLIAEGKKYFSNCKIIKNEKDHIIQFGDKITYNYNTEKITLHKSTSNIVERLNTIEFFISKFKEDLCDFKEELDCFVEESSFINRIIAVSKNFNIPLETVKLSEITDNDEYFLHILENIKEKRYNIDLSKGKEKREIIISKIVFFNNHILVMKIIEGNKITYIDYFDEDNEITLTITKNKEEIEVSRFLIIEKEGLLTSNFNKDIIIKSLNSIDNPRKDITNNEYILFALENIKAWDKSKNDEYLEVAKYILQWLDQSGVDDIININKAQIEIRYNKVISHKTRDKLYEIKFKTDDVSIKAAISILLNDTEAFNEYFGMLDIKRKKEFLSYPIYTIHLENLIK